MLRPPRIHIAGASGTGTTTLGAELRKRLGIAHLDTDAFFWMPTDPPFTTRREVQDRIDMIEARISGQAGWVISGSLVPWGDVFIPAFDLVVFLYVPPATRLPRILRREQERYGAQIEAGGRMHDAHLEFMEWSTSYDDPSFRRRSLAVHEAWLRDLTCPVLEIRDAPSVEESADRVLQALRDLP
jgi:adenylate kinase family enzyme